MTRRTVNGPSTLNPSAGLVNAKDQQIVDGHNNLNDLDKIPGIVKYLKELSGQSGERNFWSKIIDSVLTI